ncbi:MAG: phosphoribosyl-AMP cyclohydrolase [Deltaproteobacteria bacterium]|nr:phosphoribosyl-AMP cyclohydrolase [Deltaproteobacteria bacterium]
MKGSLNTSNVEEVDFDKSGGLVPAIAQDIKTGKVLMMAYMNREALNVTLREGRACYWSRSRKELWRKGATSGDIQIVKEVLVDCDLDTILLLVDQQGEGACHTKRWSCFFRQINKEGEIREIES